MSQKKIITFIIAVVIFYALLALNVLHIGDFLVPNTKDYVDIETTEMDEDEENIYLNRETETQKEHFAASDSTNLEKLCIETNMCEKIQFNGNFLDWEKHTYINSIEKIVKFIENNSKINKSIQETIRMITINKEQGNRRGYATWDSVIFNIGAVQSNKEFINLSAHEIGHITDLGYIQGTASKKDENFTEFGKIVFSINDPSLLFYKYSWNSETIRKAEAKAKDFCSGYGMTDPFEDFSECFNLYANHNSLFKQTARSNPILRKKYNFLAIIFSGNYISANTQDLLLIKNNPNWRPRDTTKITDN